MNPVRKIFGLLLASLALASCGGGGGSDGGAFTPAPQKDSSLTISATATTLPVNVWGYQPIQYGNPTQSEVTITWRRADGTLISGQTMQASIAPVTVAAMSCVVDENCDDGNQLFQSLVLEGTNGVGTVFVNAGGTAGTATLTVSAIDPDTERTVSATMQFTVKAGIGPMPAAIHAEATPNSVYLPGSGGATSTNISALVRDGAGQLIPDSTGADNIQFEIVGAAGDARLSTSSASGSASGKKVTGQTIRGVAVAEFQASETTPQGPLQIRVTADRADNNVSNGIQDPVSTVVTLVVSDGKLFSLVLTSPTTDNIVVNPVSGNIVSEDDASLPNGSYSMTVSALATDRQGNPVAPGTQIEFGVIDSPMSGFPDSGAGTFQLAGSDGDPQEGGSLFTAPTGKFRSAGGGAGPGDTLLVFGRTQPPAPLSPAPAGNRDLESARKIQAVNSETSLNVTYPFNPNDDTGTSVNNGPVLPYVIGRATEGNIGATAITGVNGVASTTLNYPVSRLGKGALIWARGAGADVNGEARLVTTISRGGFAGIAPGYLVVSQTPLPGNTSAQVQVCLYDALDAPLQGVSIGFSFVNMGTGSGSIDGISSSGSLARPTGSDGCTLGQVRSSGIGGEGSDDAAVVFSAGPGIPPLEVPLTVSGGLVLQASPSSLGGSGGTVVLLLTDSGGNPVPGVQLSGECSAGAGISGLLPITNADGRATVVVAASLTGYNPPNIDANCTFQAAGGDPSVTINLQGANLCDNDPENERCAGPKPPVDVTIGLRSASATSPITAAISSTPGGITCSVAASPSHTCSFRLRDGATYTLQVSPAQSVSWEGQCQPGPDPSKATFIVAEGASCTAVIQ